MVLKAYFTWSIEDLASKKIYRRIISLLDLLQVLRILQMCSNLKPEIGLMIFCVVSIVIIFIFHSLYFSILRLTLR